MSRTLSCLILLSALLLSPSKSSATLIEFSDLSGHVIYDNAAQHYWYWDLNAFVNQNYFQQLASIEQLNKANYFGISTWHLASFHEIWSLVDTNIFAELLMFGPSYIRPPTSTGETYAMWLGRVDAPQFGNSHLTIEYRKDLSKPISPEMYDFSYSHSGGVDWAGFNPSDDIAYNFVGAWITSDKIGPQPVPEPSSILLVGSGVAGLVVIRHKRKSKRNNPAP